MTILHIYLMPDRKYEAFGHEFPERKTIGVHQNLAHTASSTMQGPVFIINVMRCMMVVVVMIQ